MVDGMNGKKWDIWDGVFHKPVTDFYKVSICITCMDRLYTLKECLRKNIQDNSDYPNIEFVVLDYNTTKEPIQRWMLENMHEEIEQGKVAYYRTEEPRFYSMTHSRNMAFRLATGDLVNNVDADNFTGKGFASFLNFMANECPERPVFSKGKKLIRGRLGFFKRDFVEVLGGYDEDIQNYGHDDGDLLDRAMLLGFRLMQYGGRFFDRIATPRSVVGVNMQNGNWRDTQKLNRAISANKIAKGIYKANAGRNWGSGTVVKNFKEVITL